VASFIRFFLRHSLITSLIELYNKMARLIIMLRAVITVIDQPAQYLTSELCIQGVKMHKW